MEQDDRTVAEIQATRLKDICRQHNPPLTNSGLKVRLREAMLELGITDAEPTDVTISRWMTGRNVASAPYRLGLARALKVEVSDIWPSESTDPEGAQPALPFLYHEFGFRPEEVNFFRITHWNSNRQLRAQNVAKPDVVTANFQQDWISDPASYGEYVAAQKGGSPCASIRGWLIDDRESVASQKLRLEACESHYRYFIANHQYFRDHLESLSAVEERIAREGMLRVMNGAPLSNVTMNVTITSSDNFVLMMKRSEAANTYPGEWAAGPHETMNWPQEFTPSGTPGSGGQPEDVFELASRALSEEAYLFPDDYRRIVFSWFGVWIQDVSYYFFAHVKSRLSRDEISEGAMEAESAYETPEFDWLPFSRETVEAVTRTRFGEAGPALGRERSPKYLATSLVALTQLWRVRHLLETD